MPVRRTLTALTCAVLLAVGLAGCGAAPGAPGSQVGPTTPPEAAATTPPEAAATAAPAPLPTPTAPGAATPAPVVPLPVATLPVVASPPAGTGDAAGAPTAPGVALPQEVLTGTVADLASRIGVAPGEITVVTAEAVSWSDGSLGCPQPGMMYPQVITEGFRVVLSAGGKEYAYHGGGQGQLFYCENPSR